VKLVVRAKNRFGRPVPPRQLVELAREMAARQNGVTDRELAKASSLGELLCWDAIMELFDQKLLRSEYTPAKDHPTSVQELRVWLLSSHSSSASLQDPAS
jgi:hypothetical protein